MSASNPLPVDNEPKPQRQRRRRTFLYWWKGLLVLVLLLCLVGTIRLLPSLWGTSPESSLQKTAPRFSNHQKIATTTCPTESTRKATVESLHRILSNKLRRQQQRPSNPSTPTNTSPFPPQLSYICSKLGPPGTTASSLWRQHVAEILKASIHPEDTQGVHAAWTEQLLHFMSPRLLQASVRSVPHPDTWRTMLRKVQAYYQQLHKRRRRNTLRPPPALQVVVFGGSVTFGSDCQKVPPEVHPYLKNASIISLPKNIGGLQCSWPIRVQWLLDHMLGPNVINVENLAVGGTNTDSALPRIAYRLYDSSVQDSILSKHGPDVIVNSYAANDNFLPSWEEARFMSHKFTSTCLGSRPCQRSAAHRPLVLYMNDYVGNYGNQLIRESIRHDAIQQDAWYQVFGYISAVNMLWHDVILPNTDETLVSPPWHKGPQPHFQMPGHVVRAWMVAYALLEWTVQACHDGQERRIQNSPTDHDGANEQQQLEDDPLPTNGTISNNSSTTSLPTTNHPAYYDIQWTRRRRSDRHFHHHDDASSSSSSSSSSELELDLWAPPLLTPVRLSNITNAWQQHVLDCDTAEQQTGCYDNVPPCTFAFVAAPAGTIRFRNSLEDFVERVTKHQEGWAAEMNIRSGWRAKLGMVAQRPKARWVLRFENLKSPIQVLTLHYVKSYGDNWANSTAKFTFTVWNTTKRRRRRQQQPQQPLLQQSSEPKSLTTWQLQGFHDSNSTISYSSRTDVGLQHRAELGDVAELDIELIGGTTFKIISMMLCYR